ncbi:MAG: 23S rRNA pseudouridine(1911/1915/1917) synthase RluD [Xanthomonadales bacterium]|nr:23S rRNA pseudouridine(1911/1915/1917) synthase RluD [Xanthomonadales bacterium]
MAETIDTTARIDAHDSGRRLDQVLCDLFPDYSRSRLQTWTREGAIRVDGETVKPSMRVRGGEEIELKVVLRDESTIVPQDLPLDIVHADDDLLVVNKPAGLVVHPAPGNPDRTLQNALLHFDPNLGSLPRAGIVHRLDKLTSGVMVVARSLRAHASLVEQLQSRSMGREYVALVYEALIAGGTVDAPIGRHPSDRLRMAVVSGGKPATTHYRVQERFTDFTWLKLKLESGRTHQSRVHMAHLRHPVVGDPVYGGRLRLPAGAGAGLLGALQALDRQALHARRLRLRHPASDEEQVFEVPLAADLEALLVALRNDATQSV